MMSDNNVLAQDVEQIMPYGNRGSKAEQVEQMFDAIAPAYDFMNRAMTLGIDRRWRRVAVRCVRNHLCERSSGDGACHLLDVATGTGDFALQLHRDIGNCHITGIDLSGAMLEVAQRKVARQGLAGHFTLTQGDCLALPYDEGMFDAVTVAFGVRNFEHLEQGYLQMHRVLKPGGMLCVIELSTPRNKVARWFYDLYTLHIIPWVGALKSGDQSAYRYLPQSIAAVPQGDAMLDIMRHVGFGKCQSRTLTLGACSVYTAVK